MVMEQYLIHDTTLTDIGDALRKNYGETKIIIVGETEILPPKISKSSNATGFFEGSSMYKNNLDIYEAIIIPGANSVRVKMSVDLANDDDYVQVASGNLTAMPSDATKYSRESSLIELEFSNTDTITFYFHTDNVLPYGKGYYAECTGYDVEGNLVTHIVEKEREVKNTYKPSDMAEAIEGIIPILESIEVTANGTYTPNEGVDGFNEVIVDVDLSNVVPEDAFVITGNCSYRFANNGWNWFIETYGDKITTENLSNITNMFYYANTLKEIPFDLNVKKDGKNMGSVFAYSSIRKTPLIYAPEGLVLPTSSYSGQLDISDMFTDCKYLKEVPNDFFNNFISEEFRDASISTGGGARDAIFNNCYSLRQLPDLSRLPSGVTSAYNCLYYNLTNGCHSLDKIENLPVVKKTFTSNMFNSQAYGPLNNGRISEYTFATEEDGSPIVVEWKSQSIALGASNASYGCAGALASSSSETYLTSYNSGITKDKKVSDDATYQALKDDPDWYTRDFAYARYNHDSAVNTINSLPDTSAYLAGAGGTNTITFRGEAGAKTDGGAINTLTAEEIAVAAAKGWTVTLA